MILGSILGHDPEREQADQGAEAGRDPKDAAPRIGREFRQAAGEDYGSVLTVP